MSLKIADCVLTQNAINVDNYQPDNVNVGKHFEIENDALGPMRSNIIRFGEQTGIIQSMYSVVRKDDTCDYIFSCEYGTSSTRRSFLWLVNRDTGDAAYKGYITWTHATGTCNLRLFEVVRKLETTGTVSVLGTAVAGVDTLFQTNRVCVGARIGFGSTDPNEITQWFEITSIASNTGLGLAISAPTLNNVPYVIEEFNIVIAIYNTTTVNNGGVFLFKGVNVDHFKDNGTTFNDISSGDNQRGVYCLCDGTNLNLYPFGGAFDPDSTPQEQKLYILDATPTTIGTKCYVYNTNAPIGGFMLQGSYYKTADPLLYATATSNNINGTLLGGCNNGTIATVNHGVAKGIKSLYFISNTRIYRAAISGITAGNYNWISDHMVEMLPYPYKFFGNTSVVATIEYIPMIDKFFIYCSSSGSYPNRSWFSQYRPTPTPADHVSFFDSRQLDSTAVKSGAYIHPSIAFANTKAYVSGDTCYLLKNTSTQVYCVGYTFFPTTHWSYAETNNARLITPVLDTPNISSFVKILVSEERNVGEGEAAYPTEPYRLYVRTSGFNTPTGNWTPIDETLNLKDISIAPQIQIMAEFRLFGYFSVPAHFYSLGVLYDEYELPSQFDWDIENTDTSNATFAFEQKEVFEDNVDFNISYYDANYQLIFTQDCNSSTYGNINYYDGETWVLGLGPNQIGTKRKFVPTTKFAPNTTANIRITL